jgi:two-component system heavy metal sensor histidine kinase CusS
MIFERFVRFPQAAAPGMPDKGSGLGLAICRSIVQLHKGKIFATERDGASGLRMVIEIPVGA